MSSSPGKPPEETDSPLYHALLKLAILLAILSLVALGVKSWRQPVPDNHPAPFSCSSLPPPDIP